MTLPTALYTAAQVRELDHHAINTYNIPALCLMERAGAAGFALAQQLWPQAQRWGVLCGVGNNAGDGYVLARLAHIAGLEVVVWQVGETVARTEEARAALAYLHAQGVSTRPFHRAEVDDCDVIIDALLGTGLDRKVSGAWAAAVAALNTGKAPVLALDIASGLHADQGAAMGDAVKAAATLTFIGLKQGLFTGAGPHYSGDIYFHDLNVPATVYEYIRPSAHRLDSATLSPRRRDAHKGDFGHVLIIGGNHGYSGAARLAAQGALRSGAGLVSVATRRDHANLMNLNLPELMSHAVESALELQALTARASVIAIGPGLGQDEWAKRMLMSVLSLGKPLVVDADGLNLVARDKLALPATAIITPHPGEAARLLGTSNAAVQAQRFTAATDLQRQFGGVCVLKGAGTLIAAPADMPALCSAGNPGMACGGMGDVLTGVIAALWAQGLLPAEAARVGVCLHARAADKALRQHGEYGLLPSDILPYLHNDGDRD
jgi:ADP-dependent NAD(P)H-hydrate dehydratase / NAD(P)H-hydrate epimerase